MPTSQDAVTKARTTYNAASDHYDDAANSFWDRFGRRTVERLQLEPGMIVLDVCCGSGASAIPAAEAVGPGGSVVGVDLAEELLRLAREKASKVKLQNIEFRQGNLLNLGYEDGEFDVVVCVFGIFFVPDMNLAMSELWRLVRPGGQLAITTWGSDFFEPVSTTFWESIRDVRPDLYRGFNPWDRICDTESLKELFIQAGALDALTSYESGSHDLPTPESWWSAVLGSGYRGTVDQLTDAELETVKEKNLRYMRESGVKSVEANVVYGVATKS